MSLKKKKGSSLVMVLLLASALLLVGTASITTMSANVKMRVEENKRIQSLYKADAGLEVVENMIIKTYETATKYAEDVVQQTIKAEMSESNQALGSQNEDVTLTTAFNEKLNKIFKQAFVEFLTITVPIEQIDGSQTSELTSEFVQIINSNQYEYISDYEVTGVNQVKKEKKQMTLSSVEEEFKPQLKVVSSETPPIKENNRTADGISTDKYTFTVNSKFVSVEGGINHDRELEVTYNIQIPDYLGQYTSENISIYSVFNDKVLTIDENLNILNANQVKIDGNIFVVGTPPTISDDLVAYDKYQGGIKVDNASVEFTKDVVTSKTLNVLNGSVVGIQDNLYAGNLYVGNINGNPSKGNVFISKAAYLDNDLAMKALDGSSISVRDFYGLNDATFTNGDVTRTSSSVIVNSQSDATINIENSAYIMGVAYINTGREKYQTGESVAVKGNYVAYSHPLPESQTCIDENLANQTNCKTFSEVEFDYYEPLQLIKNDALNAAQKSAYFKEFYLQTTPDDFMNGGVYLPQNSQNIYTAGAIVYKDNDENLVIEKSNYNGQADSFVNEKREEYAQNVYAMGNVNVNNKLDLYKSLGVNTQQTVQDAVNWEQLKQNCSRFSDLCDSQQVKLIAEPGKTIVLGKNANQANYQDAKYIKVNQSSEEELIPTVEAFLLIDGDVIIDGPINFKGNIIATGNVSIIGGGNQQLKYDAYTTHKLITSHFEVFDQIFNSNGFINTQLVNQFESADANDQYAPKEFIKTSNWTIKK